MGKTVFIVGTLLILTVAGVLLVKGPKTGIPQQTTIEDVPPVNGQFEELIILSQSLQRLSLANSKQAIRTPFAEPIINDGIGNKFKQFSELATQVALQIDQSNEEQDLACIFRGVAEDATAKITALQEAKSLGQQARLWRDSAALFADVAMILRPDWQTSRWSGEVCKREKE